MTAGSSLALLVSGFAILLAHPRLYWGETGALGTPALIDLPLPFVLVGQSGWGRSLHFLSAWVVVAAGLTYVPFGVLTRHFRDRLMPSSADSAWSSIARVVSDHLHLKVRTEDESLAYNVLQRLTYLGVVFVLFPLSIWTGLAMSPAIVSVFPPVVTVFGGHQSARTLHFVVAASVALFFVVHVAMVSLVGFTRHMRMMITGQFPPRAEHR